MSGGWAGGRWSHYSHWTFCPTRYFGWRSYRSHWSSGAEIARTGQHRDVPRGVITGTTRGLPRGYHGRPEQIVEALDRTPPIQHLRHKLPDVTDFVARKPTLSTEVRQAIKEAHRLIFRSGLPLDEATARIEADLAQPEAHELARFCRDSERGFCRPLKRQDRDD